jgi:hypothetical protein
VSVAAQGTGGKWCRGWARVTLPDTATAAALMAQLQGQQLVSVGGDCGKLAFAEHTTQQQV